MLEQTSRKRFFEAATRVLGFVDCNPLSATAGCADRGYWHYQDGKGFPVGSYQVVMFGLEAASKIFSTSASSKTFAFAGELSVRFWAREILDRGLLDEYFTHQKSFCASAYTTLMAVLWTQCRVRDAQFVSPEIYLAIRKALSELKADIHRPDAANQTLAARIAWDIAAGSLAAEKLVEGVNPFSPRVSEAGWFYEYGGFDLGYTLKCLDLCALALSVLEAHETRSSYERYAQSLLTVLHRLIVQYTFAPALGSRGNPHLLLGGLTLFANGGCTVAQEVRNEFLNPRRFGRMVDSRSCDDKYFAFFHFNSLLLYQHAESPNLSVLPQSARLPLFSSPAYADGLSVDDAMGVLFYRFGTTRVAISLTGASAICLEAGEDADVHSGYVLRRGKNLWGPSPARIESSHVAAAIEQRQAEKISLRMPIRLARFPQRTSIVQNLYFHFFLRFVLGLPLVGGFARNVLYASVGRKKSELDIGRREIEFDKSSVMVRDVFTTDCIRLCTMGDWSMTDGHATRLHSSPQTVVSVPFDTKTGSARSVFSSVISRSGVELGS